MAVFSQVEPSTLRHADQESLIKALLPDEPGDRGEVGIWYLDETVLSGQERDLPRKGVGAGQTDVGLV